MKEGQEGVKRAQMVIIIACGAEKKGVAQGGVHPIDVNSLQINNNNNKQQGGGRRDGRGGGIVFAVVVVVVCVCMFVYVSMRMRKTGRKRRPLGRGQVYPG